MESNQDRSDAGRVTAVRNSINVTALQYSLDDTPVPGNFSVTAWDVIEHLPESVVVMRSLCEALLPGGGVILRLPDAEAFTYPLVGVLNRLL